MHIFRNETEGNSGDYWKKHPDSCYYSDKHGGIFVNEYWQNVWFKMGEYYCEIGSFDGVFGEGKEVRHPCLGEDY